VFFRGRHESNGAGGWGRLRRARGDDSWGVYAVKLAVIAGAYYGSAKLGLNLAFATRSVTAIWPPTGLALAAFVLWGYRVWPGVALGALLANSWTGVPLVTVLGITCGNTLEGVAGAYLLRRLGGFRPSLERLRDVLALVVLAAAVSTTISATVGVMSLVIGDAVSFGHFGSVWRVWWLGDMGGDLLVAPALMVAATHWPFNRAPGRAREAAALTAVLLAVSVFVFSQGTNLAYLVFPVLIWAALRFWQPGAAGASLAVASIAVVFTANHHGPFVRSNPDDSLLLAQTFVGVAGVTMLLLAAQAVERGRLYGAEREARAQAEGARERLAFLAGASQLLSRSLDVDQILERLAQLTVPRLADWCSVDLVDDAGFRNVAITHVDPDRVNLARELRRRYPIDPEDPTGAPNAVRTGMSELYEEVTDELLRQSARDDEHLRILRELDLMSAMVVPLSARGRTLGAVTFVSAESKRRFGPEDLQLAEDFASRAALATDNALLYQHEHEAATSLQNSLLPRELPTIPGIQLAARYLPATHELEVGGDWYDVIVLPSGEVALVIGDVAGRGLDAATVMGQLRTTTRVYAFAGYSPAETVERLNATVADAFDPSDMATLVYLVLDPASSTVRYVNAGHLPPLVLGPDSKVSQLDGPHSLPIGVRPYGRYQAVEARLEVGSTLILYTDGLIERRGESIDNGIERLRMVLEHASASFDELPDALLEQVAPADQRSDDIALLALRTVHVGTMPLRLTLPAEFSALSSARRALRRWLEQIGADPAEAHEILTACGEACANAIEHAYGPQAATFQLAAVVDGAEVAVAVRDFGGWRPARDDSGRGLGIKLMSLFMDGVDIDRTSEGTEVRLHRRLRSTGST
jgi:serine phosphatase RsbU (regulator of sigma subunit)/integral membrane sensor domain MASE1/anti-sigma regulatory factor (Ser/Thr protein kinase)